MRHLATAVALLLAGALPLAASTISNNDSCDIGTYPAATLLLPYFEVDLSAAHAQTTIFSVTNVSPAPQIANVTIWTDWGFPVISFPLFLTGYDAQPINLYDIIGRGIIAPPRGTSIDAPNARDGNGNGTNPTPGTQPLTNLANPHFLSSVSTDCAAGRLPGQIPGFLIDALRSIFTTGVSTGSLALCPGPARNQLAIGGSHGANTAAGYVTIDVVSTCSPLMPNDPLYWDEVLNDNVLTGDYQQIASDPVAGNYAGGNPMVHIRAVPNAALPFTFYDRFTKKDARQPLPSTFAARWIQGTNAAFDTDYKIWREGVVGIGVSCDRFKANATLGIAEIVRFDEHENASIATSSVIFDPPAPPPTLPAASRVHVRNSSLIPVLNVSQDSGGWMYFNLNNGSPRGVSQNWVVTSMFAEGRFGVEADATSLANGCSPAAPTSVNGTIGVKAP
jgi:hypothetical protein